MFKRVRAFQIALVLGLGVAAVAATPSFAIASTGGIANAFANPDWSRASFAVTVSGTPCGLYACSWFPVVTAQPSLPEYRCLGDEALDSDRNTEMVWKGAARTANANEAATVSNAPILRGVIGQRLCLSIIGSRSEISAVCEAQRKTIEEFTGEPAAPCLPESRVFSERISDVLLQIESSPPPPPVQGAAPNPVPAPQPTPACLKARAAKSKADRRLYRARLNMELAANLKRLKKMRAAKRAVAAAAAQVASSCATRR